MSMATAMEWEAAPIPVWIEALSIDADEEMPVSDLMVSIPTCPVVMDGSPCTHVSSNIHSFLSTSSTTDQSTFGTLLDDKHLVGSDRDSISLMLDLSSISIVVESPTKPKYTSLPSLSPVKSKRVTAKPERQHRLKASVDPSGREQRQRRKDKQRGYEKNYRSRQKDKRFSDEAEWIQLETQVRKMLAKRTSVVVLGSLDTPRQEFQSPSTVSIRQRYLELLQEERALREAEALDSTVLAEYRSIALWGGATATSREIRAQVNALPSLRSCHTFDFAW